MNNMAGNPSTSRDSSNNLTGSISSIEINDNSSSYMYDSLGRLIKDNGDDNVEHHKMSARRSWSGYQTLPANFKQHHCHVSRKRVPSLAKRQHLIERPCRSLNNSPVRVWRGCLGRSQTESPSRNRTEYTNGSLDGSQESISNIQHGPLGGCCGGHWRTVSETNPPEEGIRRSQTACTPLASLKATLRRSMSEGEPNSITSGGNSPIRLVPNPQGSLVESPRRLVKLRIKCDHASYPHQVSFAPIYHRAIKYHQIFKLQLCCRQGDLQQCTKELVNLIVLK